MIITKKIRRQNSEPNLAMRRAWASRASTATRGICFTLSNREPDLLELELSHCKQTEPTRSNRELSTICNPRTPRKKAAQNSKNPVSIYRWSGAPLTGTAPQTEFDLTHRKQSAETFLTRARTPCGDPATRFPRVRPNLRFFPHNMLSMNLNPHSLNAKFNRQIHELELHVTYRKQKAAPGSNCQKSKKWPNAFLISFPSAQIPPRSLNASTENEF